MTHQLAEEHTATASRGLVETQDGGIVLLEGLDSLDLLQRLSTNDVLKLGIPGVETTVLTNEKGRIVDVVTVLRLDSHRIMLVGHNPARNALKQWLERYVIMEDVRVESAESNFLHLLIFGDETLATSIGHGQWVTCERVFPTLNSTGFAFVKSWPSAKIIHVLINRNGAFGTTGFGYSVVGHQHFEDFRIARGIPAFPNELSASYNPLEAGLTHWVSFTKGCYIGQEVLARLDTYKKVQRRLVRMYLPKALSKIPTALVGPDGEAGLITSVGNEDSTGRIPALGYLLSSAEEKKDRLFVNVDGTHAAVTIIG